MGAPETVPVGPSSVRLSNWAELVSAAADGLLDESTFSELKKGLPPAGQNVETARDLASLSVLGGVFVVGVVDAGGGRAGDVVGVPGSSEVLSRLVAVADGAVQPSLVCDVYVLPHPEDAERGCVVCVVPPSPMAPHLVDGRYWGRTSKGKRVLSDPEVSELFARRRFAGDDFREHLEGLAGDFDPVPVEERHAGHLYFSAWPLQPSPTAIGPPWDPDEHVLRLVNRAGMPVRGHGWGDLGSLTWAVAHPDGIMAVSFDPGAPRERDEQYLARLLVRDGGGVDFACGLGTTTRERPAGGQPVKVVPLGAVIAYVDECVRVAGQVSREAGLNGMWRLGVRMDRLLGAFEMGVVGSFRMSRPSTFPEDTYVRVVDVTATRLRDDVAGVVESLMQPLARGLGMALLFPYDPDDLRSLFRS